MDCQLADDVQVRKESWGLLLYSQRRHKICFVKSGDWLDPEYFNRNWTVSSVAGDIAKRTGNPPKIVEHSLHKLTGCLKANRMIVDELC